MENVLFLLFMGAFWWFVGALILQIVSKIVLKVKPPYGKTVMTFLVPAFLLWLFIVTAILLENKGFLVKYIVQLPLLLLTFKAASRLCAEMIRSLILDGTIDFPEEEYEIRRKGKTLGVFTVSILLLLYIALLSLPDFLQ